LTGVDPNNFNATLLLFTSITAGFLLAVLHGFLGCINGLGALARGLWQWLESRMMRLPTVGAGWADILIGLCIRLCVFGLWNHSCVDVLQGYVADMAKFVRMQYEFAYDPTCAASSEYRWVAPHKDRKELKPSNVLAATYFALN
jgi:hypothetical protein